jgi:TAT (twin-arginine translocation) pathway signal sequence
MNRRDFIKTTAAGAATTLAGSSLLSAQTSAAPAPPSPGTTMVAMPICVAPLVGPEQELDRILGDMKDRGGVNALFPFMYSHEEHRAGVPEHSPGFRGGNYATPHMPYYKGSILTYADMKAPEFGDVDVLARVIPIAAKHGIKVFPFVLEDNHSPAAVPTWRAALDPPLQAQPLLPRVAGRPGGGLCPLV